MLRWRISSQDMSLYVHASLLAPLNHAIDKGILLTFLLKSYDLYLRIARSPLAARQRTLKTEILTTKSELLKTSAQDQFAKWAKLRRSVDKGLADLEKLSEYFCVSGNIFSCFVWIASSVHSMIHSFCTTLTHSSYFALLT